MSIPSTLEKSLIICDLENLSLRDSNLLRGVKKLANYLGLTELIKKLESAENHDFVTLDLEGKKEIRMSIFESFDQISVINTC